MVELLVVLATRRSRAGAVLAALLAVPTLWGCSDVGVPSAVVTETLPSGRVVVTHDAPSPAGTHDWSLERTLRVGEVEGADLPTEYPVFTGFTVDAESDLWVHRMTSNGGWVFEVFDASSGDFLASVSTELEGGWGGAAITMISEEHLVAVVRDELGVQYVEVWRIHRS